MMKKLVTAMLGIFLSLSAFAQMMPDSTFQVVAYWDKGDKISYQSTSRTIKKTPDGKEEVQKSSSEVRTFEVMDQTDSTYILRMSYSDVFSSQLSLEMGADVYAKIMEAETIDLLTDECGKIQDLLNIDEVVENLAKAVPQFVDAASAKFDAKVLQQIKFDRNQWIDEFTKLLANPEVIRNSCSKSAGMLLRHHGMRLDPKKEYVMENEYPNLFGNGGMNGEMHFWVDKEMSDSVSVVIRSHTEADAGTLLPLIRDASLSALRATLPEDKYEEAATFVLLQFSQDNIKMSFVEDTGIVIDLGRGWPVDYSATQTIITQKGNNSSEVVNIIKIKYKDPEEP